MYIHLNNGKVYEIIDAEKTIFLRGDVTTIPMSIDPESVPYSHIERFISDFLKAPHYKVMRRQDAKTPSKIVYSDDPFCTFVYRDVKNPTNNSSCGGKGVFLLPNERDYYCMEHAVSEGFVVESLS